MSFDTRGYGNGLMEACHLASLRSGWWSNPKNGDDLKAIVNDPGSRLGKALVAEKLCLIHSEISEAMEGHRGEVGL